MFDLREESRPYRAPSMETPESSSSRIEQLWRRPSAALLHRADELGRVFVSRWTHSGNEVKHVTHCGSEFHHIVAIDLKFTLVKFVQGGRTLIDGISVPGTIHVTAPGIAVEATYRSACDVLHIFVTQQILAQCLEDAFGTSYSTAIIRDDPNVRRDPTIERLGQLLASTDLWDSSERFIFTDSIGRAIISRLAEHWSSVPAPSPERACGLPKWRLRRATEYIDAHLTESVRLSDIAQIAGLSRMHFAAQFRRSMGVSPHEYVLRRRLEVAQGLLLHSDSNSLDIALSCGFNSQAHFISVFSRYMGDTPCRWRRNSLDVVASG